MSDYTDAVEAGLKDLHGISVGGICPGCETCWGEHAPDATEEDFREMWANGEVYDYGNEFSTSPCGICGTRMAGRREVWHWIADDGTIMHEDDACTDCVMFWNNGDEPEQWER